MKKLIALLMLLCFIPLSALAEMDEDGDVVVTLEGAEFFFTPIEGYCVTRESSASVFNRLGMSQREMVPVMEAHDIFALLFDEAMTLELHVSAYATVETDFDEMNEFGETMMCESFQNYYTDMGYEVTSVEIYLAPEGHRFICSILSYTYEDGTVEHMVEYLTCQAGYTVAITLYPYEGAPTEEQIALAETVADSLWVKATE